MHHKHDDTCCAARDAAIDTLRGAAPPRSEAARSQEGEEEGEGRRAEEGGVRPLPALPRENTPP